MISSGIARERSIERSKGSDLGLPEGLLPIPAPISSHPSRRRGFFEGSILQWSVLPSANSKGGLGGERLSIGAIYVARSQGGWRSTGSGFRGSAAKQNDQNVQRRDNHRPWQLRTAEWHASPPSFRLHAAIAARGDYNQPARTEDSDPPNRRAASNRRSSNLPPTMPGSRETTCPFSAVIDHHRR